MEMVSKNTTFMRKLHEFYLFATISHSCKGKRIFCNHDSELGLTWNSKKRCYQVAIGCCLSISSLVTYELLCSSLLFRFSGQARDKYHSKPPNIIVIPWISWESAKYLPNICPQLLSSFFSATKLFTAPGYSCFVYLNPVFVAWNSFSFLSQTALWRQTLFLLQRCNIYHN